ncbi:excinuclease ABC subunit UvrC [Candidatus Nomurabacteria bacterium]|nr:excinuclease ABC subunit UvrC [Candidatus Nomurabacteria bacterium]
MSIKQALAVLPKSPGVYIFKNTTGQVIYVGKAINLSRRVKSYFQKRDHDLKTARLVEKIADIEMIETESELAALLLEAELIKRYKPQYNILLRDDKHYLYIRVSKDPYPIISYVRRIENDYADYYGPFPASYQVKKLLTQIRRVIPFITDQQWPKVSKLSYQIGINPSPDVDPDDYRDQIRRIKLILTGKFKALAQELEMEMQASSQSQDYEKAALIRNQLRFLSSLRRIKGVMIDSIDLSADSALLELGQIAGLDQPPARIEAYDISNFQGKDQVASMVVFTSGLPDTQEYRKFKIKTKGPNDFAMMQEVVTRRQKRSWEKPDLILIDGGKGQLSSALKAMQHFWPGQPVFGLAKREEEMVFDQDALTKVSLEKYRQYIYQDGNYWVVKLPKSNPVSQLIQRIRDEAHRYAITYHRQVRKKRIIRSKLEDYPGIGPKSVVKLIKAFGSEQGVLEASQSDLKRVLSKKGQDLYDRIQKHK